MAGGHRARYRERKPKASAEPAVESVPPKPVAYESRIGRDPGTRISSERISDFIDRVFGDGPAQRERDAA